MTTGEFVGGLLHAVTVAHVLHLKATGPGSYARHVALGELYEALSDLTDGYAEAYQGCYGVIDGYPESFEMPGEDPVEWVKGLSRFVQENRKKQPEDSELQNVIDEIQQAIDKALYKLTVLA